MTAYSQGEFTPTNTSKYIGKFPIQYRSSWELSLMRVLDNHPNVTQWASESISIPYEHPLTGKWTFYIPDFLVVFVDKAGKKRAEVIEVKPAKEAMVERAKSKKDKLVLAVNQAKWKAAIEWCHKNGMTFKVLTEEQLFANPKNKK